MGTLTDQPPRNYKSITDTDIRVAVGNIKDIAKNHGITIDQAIKIYEIIVQERRTDVYVDNGDIWDEQIGGIGKILEEISDSVKFLATKDSVL